MHEGLEKHNHKIADEGIKEVIGSLEYAKQEQ